MVGEFPPLFVVARPEASEYNSRACAVGEVGRKFFISWSLCPLSRMLELRLQETIEIMVV